MTPARSVEACEETAVLRPRALEPADLERCEAAVRHATQHDAAHALRILGEIIYNRPGLAGISTMETLGAASMRSDLPAGTRDRAVTLLASFLSSPCGSDAVRIALHALSDPNIDVETAEALVEMLDAAVYRYPGLVDLDGLIALTGHPHLPAGRTRLEQVIEHAVLAVPEAVTPERFDRLLRAFGGDADARYLFHYLATVPGADEAIRERAAAACAGSFPLREKVGEALRRGARRVLAVQNIADAQGDEIIRVAPLLQSLLDGNPELSVTLLTQRGYLYAHKRIATIPIGRWRDHTATLFEPFDVVADFTEERVEELCHDLLLWREVMARKESTLLSVRASKDRNHFLFDRVDVEGEPWADALGLNRLRAPNVYEPVFRLIAELGLPLPSGGARRSTNPVLAGVPWEEADRRWDELTAKRGGRPAALLYPFGGAEPLKGYGRPTLDRLAAGIQGLVAEGFFVVIQPNDTAWGKRAIAEEVLARLAEDEARHVAVAPDEPPSNRSGLLPGEYHARLVTHFIRRADLVVAVEGWVGHAAWCLGKPYRIVMMPRSGGLDWVPYGSTRQQRIVDAPPEAVRRADGTGLEESAAGIPLEGGARKSVQLLVLESLGESGNERMLPVLEKALRSEDRDVRAVAARALVTLGAPDLDTRLTALLDDPYYCVRAIAAGTLIERGYDLSSRLGPDYEAQLRIHEAIGRQDWQVAVSGRRAAVRPMEIALRDDDPTIRREAMVTFNYLLLLNHTFAPRQQPEGRTGLLSRLTRSHRGAQAPEPEGERVLVLTPLKDAIEILPRYCELLGRLTYPHHLISLGLLESDSQDATFEDMARRIPALRREFRRVGIWRRHFGYRIPPGIDRSAEAIQAERRTVLARSRNHLLFHALDDEDWVLWVDVDVIDYPPDILEQLLATGKDIVHPHGVRSYGGRTFDCNAWREHGALHLDAMRGEGDLVPLDTVGGTMLLVRADAHRDGLVFPPFPYGLENPLHRPGRGELETEGLGLMARDMGYDCWGMPGLETLHRNG